MPVKVEAEVDARGFVAAVKRFSPVMLREMQLMLARRTGPRAVQAARRLTRRRTGALRRSLYHGVNRPAPGRPLIFRFGYDTRELRPRPYSQWIEYGTAKRPGDHVLYKTRKRQRRKIERDLQEALERAGRIVF